MEETSGVYVMRVAAMLSGMHPQTLRKYERAGFLAPTRSKTLRMYSDEDIARLKMIKHLVNEVGLNLAGVDVALNLRACVLSMKREVGLAHIDVGLEERLGQLLDDMLGVLGTEARRRPERANDDNTTE